jgi:uncharacterized repeat protein (TIGR01451 family)
MGNGRWLSGSMGSSSGRRLVRVRALGAMFLLLVAGAVLLESGSHRYAQKATAPVPASPIPIFSGSSLPSKPLFPKPDARAILGQLPLIFEPNQGQADPSVKFLARGAGYSLFLDTTGAVLGMQTAHSSPNGQSEQFVRMKLVGANPAAVTAGTDKLPGKSNYLIGNDPHQWHTGIPQFAGVHYASVYPGIDLVFYGNQGHLEYDFQVAPGANPSQAELQFDGAAKLELSGGDLVLTGLTHSGKDDGGLRLQAPHVYQRDGDRHQPVAGRFVLRAANRVGFEIGPYDRSRELIIDPALNFSTYFGGSGSETSPSVAVNSDGFIYLVGTTQGSPESSPAGSPGNSFPPAGTVTLIPPTLSLTSSSPSHIFVAKINPSQPSVVYETFIGGSGSDNSIGIGVDNGGSAYIVGNTTSPDFPHAGIFYQSAPLPKGTQCASITCTSVFVSVLSGLDPTGATLKYSSYLSGNGNDQASAMTTDTQGDVFVTGATTSNNPPSLNPPIDFPATNLPVPFQTAPTQGSSIQFFVTEVNTNRLGASGITYSTYFGGGSVPAGAVAVGGGIAVDSTGNIYFSGTTNFYNSGQGSFGDSGSEDFPILNAYQPCLDTPPPTILTNSNPCSAPATTPYPTDAFVAKLNPNNAQTGGAQLLFSTYLGGAGTDSGTAIAIDAGAANIYLTGSTNSPSSPTPGGFVIPTGIAAFQLCLDTPPPNVLPCPVITGSPVPSDAYVARLSNPVLSTTGTPNDVALTYFSYLGGGGNDSGLAIAVDTSSDALVTGSTNSGLGGTAKFPVTTGPIQSVLNGTQNAFFARIDTTTVTGQNGVGSYATYFGGNGVDRGTSIAVDPFLNIYFAGDTTSSINFETANPLPGPGGSTLNGPSDAFVVKLGPENDLCITCVAPVVSPLGTVSAGNQVTITFTVANEGPDPASGIFVNGTVPAGGGVTFNSATAGSGTCSAPSGNAVVCQIPTLQSGSNSAVTFTVTPNSSGNYAATATVVNVNNTVTNITTSAPFTASAYSVSISPSAQTVAAGSIAKYFVQVNPNGVFGANISLTCSAAPLGASCTFTNSTITLNGGSSASTVLNLTTTPQPVTVANSGGWRAPLYALWLMVPGMALLGLGVGGKRRGWRNGNGKNGNWRDGKPSRLLGLLMLSVLFALVLLQPSCSGNKTPPTVSGTPSGTYPLTVTATSGSFAKSASFSLTVIP